jgi:hypothetical protein
MGQAGRDAHGTNAALPPSAGAQLDDNATDALVTPEIDDDQTQGLSL